MFRARSRVRLDKLMIERGVTNCSTLIFGIGIVSPVNWKLSRNGSRFMKIVFVRAVGKSLTTTQQRDFNWRNGPRDVLNIREKRRCQRRPVNCSTRRYTVALFRFPSYRVTAAFRRASLLLSVCTLQSPSKCQTTNERYIFGPVKTTLVLRLAQLAPVARRGDNRCEMHYGFYCEDRRNQRSVGIGSETGEE